MAVKRPDIKEVVQSDMKDRELVKKQPEEEEEPEENFKNYSFRMSETDIKKLNKYFRSRGLKQSTGVRFILKEFMRNNNL